MLSEQGASGDMERCRGVGGGMEGGKDESVDVVNKETRE